MGSTYLGRRPVHLPSEDVPIGTISSTAGPTALTPFGFDALSSTSTSAPVVFTLGTPKANMRKVIAVESMGSSSGAPFHIETSSSGATFDGTNDAVVLTTDGAAIALVALSSSRWMIESDRDATLAAST